MNRTKIFVHCSGNAASHDEIVPMGDTRELCDTLRPGVATLRVIDGTAHESASGPDEFWEGGRGRTPNRGRAHHEATRTP